MEEFRRDLFGLVDLAMAGEEVWVTYEGGRFRIAPEQPPYEKLSRITPMDLINTDGPGLEDKSWKEEIMLEWERSWEGF